MGRAKARTTVVCGFFLSPGPHGGCCCRHAKSRPGPGCHQQRRGRTGPALGHHRGRRHRCRCSRGRTVRPWCPKIEIRRFAAAQTGRCGAPARSGFARRLGACTRPHLFTSPPRPGAPRSRASAPCQPRQSRKVGPPTSVGQQPGPIARFAGVGRRRKRRLGGLATAQEHAPCSWYCAYTGLCRYCAYGVYTGLARTRYAQYQQVAKLGHGHLAPQWYPLLTHSSAYYPHQDRGAAADSARMRCL